MPPTTGSNKRKEGPKQANQGRKSKKTKLHDARTIQSQLSDAAFSNGELNVEKFVKAREFEIRALEDGMRNSKSMLSTRAHQELPRELRRRTASHNVKRVPKRLRERAKYEMKVDNTPKVTSRRKKASGHQRLRLETAQRLKLLSKKSKARGLKKKVQKDQEEIHVTNSGSPSKSNGGLQASDTNVRKMRAKAARLREPPLPPARFRKRQLQKTWLPTHLWHSKRARMTEPKLPLWRWALPLTPIIKSYRNAHRAHADRGAVAWDMSYIATIGLSGPESSIFGLLKALGVPSLCHFNPWGKSGAKWQCGRQALNTWIHERDARDVLIAPVTILWSPGTALSDEKSPNSDRRQAFIRVHPSAFFQLWEQITRLARVQKPSIAVEDLRFEIGSIEISGPHASETLAAVLRPTATSPNTADEDVWIKLASVPPASLPNSATLALTVADPRLRHPPQTLKLATEEEQMALALELTESWPRDATDYSSPLFSRNARLKAARMLPTQSSINRRKARSEPGQYPEPLVGDPQIPVIAFTTNSTHCGNGSGTWTVLVPFKCVAPVWNSLVCYPLSCGGTIRFGGINEQRQLSYESGVAWFPADSPGTQAGKDWEVRESARRKAEWNRRPKGRRLEFEQIDLGNDRKGEIGAGWCCDWQRLLRGQAIGSEQKISTALEFRQLPLNLSLPSLRQEAPEIATNALAAVQVEMVGRGRPETCARIYRLPTDNEQLRRKWLDQQAASQVPRTSRRKADLAIHTFPRIEDLPQPGCDEYPVVPDETDLVGFITTGNFSLAKGRGVGTGSLLFARVVSHQAKGHHVRTVTEHARDERFLCIVRNAGECHGRLARWSLI